MICLSYHFALYNKIGVLDGNYEFQHVFATPRQWHFAW